MSAQKQGLGFPKWQTGGAQKRITLPPRGFMDLRFELPVPVAL